ncbi:MAG: carbon storage regulator [Gemmataceae bacterium]
MLVLSRKVGEKILIGNGIVVTVLESKGRQIRLGIEAPANVSVWRGELVANNEQLEHAHPAEKQIAHHN